MTRKCLGSPWRSRETKPVRGVEAAGGVGGRDQSFGPLRSRHRQRAMIAFRLVDGAAYAAYGIREDTVSSPASEAASGVKKVKESGH